MYMLVPHTQPSPKMKYPNTWKPSGLGCFKLYIVRNVPSFCWNL